MKKWRPESVLDLYNLLLATFLFGSPWLFGYVNGNARVDAWATGALIALTSVGALIAFADWEEWVNLFLGIWLILAPWILGFAHTRSAHVSIPIGALVVFLAALQLWMERYDKPSLDANRNSGGR